MPELSLEAKEEIRKYLESREKRLVVFGGTGLLTLLGLLGGFLTYVIADVRTRSELVAVQKIESLRLDTFDPRLRQLDDQIRLTQERFNAESLRVTATIANIDNYKRDIEELWTKAKQAIEDVDKAQGSLLFADTILKIREEIMTIKSLQAEADDTHANAMPLSDLLEPERRP